MQMVITFGWSWDGGLGEREDGRILLWPPPGGDCGPHKNRIATNIRVHGQNGIVSANVCYVVVVVHGRNERIGIGAGLMGVLGGPVRIDGGRWVCSRVEMVEEEEHRLSAQ